MARPKHVYYFRHLVKLIHLYVVSETDWSFSKQDFLRLERLEAYKKAVQGEVILECCHYLVAPYLIYQIQLLCLFLVVVIEVKMILTFVTEGLVLLDVRIHPVAL